MPSDQISGKALYVPRIDRTLPSHMDLLRIYNKEDLHNLSSGTWGIKEPSGEWEGSKRTNGECIICIYALMYAVDSQSLEVLDEGCEQLDLILVPGACPLILECHEITKGLFISRRRI